MYRVRLRRCQSAEVRLIHLPPKLSSTDVRKGQGMIRTAALCVSCLAMIAGSASVIARPIGDAGQRWSIYRNVRFGYQICYPPALLKAQGEAPNSDGQRFQSTDGAVLLVFGSNNVLERTLMQEALDQASSYTGKGGSITYRAARDNWVVLSGRGANGTSFYMKTVRRANQFLIFQLRYPRAAEQRYNEIAAKLESCFKVYSAPAF